MNRLVSFFHDLALHDPGLALLLSLAIGLPGFAVACYQVLWPPLIVFVSKVLLKRENLTGTWLLVIYKPDNKAYKVDRYSIKHRGNRLRGKIERIYSAEDDGQIGTRKYRFEGFYYGNEVIYAFWPGHPAVHSYGCCDLKREYDFTFKGLYFVPLGKRSRRKQYEIRLTQNPDLVARLEQECSLTHLPYGTLPERIRRRIGGASPWRHRRIEDRG